MELQPDDLVDASEVAEILGLSSPRAVSVYRGRYEDFPVPFLEKASGKCVLWLRDEIEQWAVGPRERKPERRGR